MSSIRGVYFLANDKVVDMAIAFLNSFRKYNPEILFCLIPYSSDIKILNKLSTIYNFTIFSDNRILEECDKISYNLHCQILGHYRKLAAWEGEFDEFIYIDIDTVVLASIDFAFQFISNYDFITSHSSIPAIRKFVWKDSVYTSDILNHCQINYAANTGFFVSHKSVLSISLVKHKLVNAIKLLPYMELMCAEQPFLNYLFVTSGKYTSLHVIRYVEKRNDIALECWAGYPFLSIILIFSKILPFKKYNILLIHWAGLWQAGKFDRWIVSLYKFWGLKKELPLIRFVLKQKILWKYFRNLKPEVNDIVEKS
jgi:hypothetical protein